MSDMGTGRRRGPVVPGEFDARARTGRGHVRGTQDMGTVALAVSGMTFYWMMPMLMGRRRRKKGGGATPTP